MSMQWLLAILPWLAILACPLFMLWMMRGMHGDDGGNGKKGAEGDLPAAREEITELRARLARLEDERTQGGVR